MLIWFAETTLIASVLAVAALIAGRWLRIGPVARHALWLAVLIKLAAPPLVNWPKLPQRQEVATRVEAPVEATIPEVAEPISEPVEPDRGVVETVSLIEPPSEPEPDASVEVVTTPGPEVQPKRAAIPVDLAKGAVLAWGIATAVLVLWHATRILVFRHRLGRGVPAPKWLVEEARGLGAAMGVRVPEILVLPDPRSPMLWFLGRPKLIVPARLVETMGLDGWRGILAHELAHIRRRDHWVRRLELVAGLFWWWNPLYWLTCRRLDAEAELACDEWAIRSVPEGRFAYAEALLEVCESLSPAASPVPALGVSGAGRFLERRMTMILAEPSPTRSSVPALLLAGLLALLALPGWGSTEALAQSDEPAPAPSSRAEVSDDDNDREDRVGDDESGDRDEDEAKADDDDDDDKAKEKAKSKEKADDEKAKARKERKEARKEKKKKIEKKLSDDDDSDTPKILKELEVIIEKLGDEIEVKFGPGSEFQKAMEELGPKLEKAMKGLEEDLESKFGPNSEFVKEMTEKFGPNSEFAKEMTEKFGPDSEFAKELSEKFGPNSEFARELGEKLSRVKKGAESKGDEPEMKAEGKKKKRVEVEVRVEEKKEKAGEPEKNQRKAKSRQILEIQKQIEKLNDQLKKLQAEEQEDEDGDDEEDEDDMDDKKEDGDKDDEARRN